MFGCLEGGLHKIYSLEGNILLIYACIVVPYDISLCLMISAVYSLGDSI